MFLYNPYITLAPYISLVSELCHFFLPKFLSWLQSEGLSTGFFLPIHLRRFLKQYFADLVFMI